MNLVTERHTGQSYWLPGQAPGNIGNNPVTYQGSINID